METGRKDVPRHFRMVVKGGKECWRLEIVENGGQGTRALEGGGKRVFFEEDEIQNTKRLTDNQPKPSDIQGPQRWLNDFLDIDVSARRGNEP